MAVAADSHCDFLIPEHIFLNMPDKNGYGQIFKENLAQNQRFCVETQMFRPTITIMACIILL